MRYTVELLNGYIKAELWDRQSTEETRPFWEAILEATRKHDVTRVLISVRSSKPVFELEDFGLTNALAQVAVMGGVKVALVSDSDELAKAHGHIERLARMRGLRFRAFRDEQAATDWLTGD